MANRKASDKVYEHRITLGTWERGTIYDMAMFIGIGAVAIGWVAWSTILTVSEMAFGGLNTAWDTGSGIVSSATDTITSGIGKIGKGIGSVFS